jgi:hypothetical protein
MENKQLLEKLSLLGFPLLETTETFDVNETLAEVVKTENARLWEGFPILLANAAKEGLFDYSKVDSCLKKREHKARLKGLFLLSLALYKLNGLGFNWAEQYGKELSDEDLGVFRKFLVDLRGDVEFDLAGYRFSSERIKNAFLNYSTVEAGETRAMLDRRDEMSLEFSLSQVFSSKQKELFKKKLKGAPFTKTEREYFSRSVKKTVMALANPELHRLAQKVAEL